MKQILVTLLFTVLASVPNNNCFGAESLSAENELRTEMKQVFSERALASITGVNPEKALAYYDTTTKLGRWAQAHEQSKLEYIQLWPMKRGLRITEVESSHHIPWLTLKDNRAELIAHQSLKLGYVYHGDLTVHYFGVGTSHWMELVKKDGKWLIQKDFYTDACGDNILVLNPTPADGYALTIPFKKLAAAKNESPALFDRDAAVRYADKYAGLPWGAGNSNKYNSRYVNLNDRGGDCTNFVSQCLGDSEGGKLPKGGGWFYDFKHASGSEAWVRASSFGDWLVYSGRGERLASGTFPELNQPNSKFPLGAVRELQKGDVIGYGTTSSIEHFAIVVGHDSKGYPLVNAHNVDRYHCPWDMGYDKSTIYDLYKVKDN